MVDVSSYNQPLPAGPFEMVKNLQSMEQQKLGIDQTKLNLINQHHELLNRELDILANDPHVTKEKVSRTLNSFAKMVNMPNEVYQKMIGEFSDVNEPDQIRERLDLVSKRNMDNVARYNANYGAPGAASNNQTITPTRQYMRGPPVPVGAPVQIQPAPTTEVATPQGTQQLGPQVPQIPEGAVPVQGGLPGQYQAAPMPQNRLPVRGGPSANSSNPEASNGAIVPKGPMVSQPPLFEEGKKQLTEDQALATQRLTAIKPAQQALSLMEGLRTGPGTETFNKAVAFLKANGIINVDQNDPTAIYQEVSKKLAQYIQGNPIGQRSDAAQVLAEASSPNMSTQISPALIKLTRDAIALDRVQASRPGAFKGNPAEYGAHRSSFPQSIDERAFTIDLFSPVERTALLNDMKKKKDTPEGKKFWKSLAIANEQELLEPPK